MNSLLPWFEGVLAALAYDFSYPFPLSFLGAGGVVCCCCACLKGVGGGLIGATGLHLSSLVSCWTMVRRLAMVVACSSAILVGLLLEVVRAETWVLRSQTEPKSTLTSR